MLSNNPWAELVAQIESGEEDLTPSEFAARYFLNPKVKKAVRNDPDGSHHFKLQVTDTDGNALKNLRKGQPIPFALRWYRRK